MKKTVSATTVICIILSVVLAAVTLAAWLVFLPAYKAKHFTAPAPSNLSVIAATESRAAFGDYYVSPDGNDKNIGTFEHPFRTIEAAQKAARKTDKQYLSHVVVSILGGTYPTKGLTFTKADSGTDTCSVIYCAYGNGDVILDGGADAMQQNAADGTSLVTIDGASYFSLSGVSIVNASGTGLTVKGSNVNVEGCVVRQVAGRGIEGKGTKISVTNCQISYTGASGLFISGGEFKTLKPSENVVDNNLVSYTSQLNGNAPSVSVGGVGTVVSHNEIVNSPAAAVYYMGSLNKIEYNYIHNTVLTNNEHAAVDSPCYRWDCYGNTVRFNCLNLIGSKGSGRDFIGIRPCSGTEITQNLLLNVCGENAAGVLLAGGRDVTVTNNIFVNTGEAVTGTDYPAEYVDEALELLKSVPAQSKVWQETLPACAGLSTDPDSENYAARPANNTVATNVCMQQGGSVGSFSAGFKKGVTEAHNAVYAPGKKNVFADLNGGDYTVNEDSDAYRSMKEFRSLPFDEIGRY